MLLREVANQFGGSVLWGMSGKQKYNIEQAGNQSVRNVQKKIEWTPTPQNEPHLDESEPPPGE